MWLALAVFTTLAQRFLGWRLAAGLIGSAGALFTLGLLLVAAGSFAAASVEQRSTAPRERAQHAHADTGISLGGIVADHERSWVPVATYAAGYEADLAVARLDAAGISAVRRDNDTVGIFGPGFDGPSARGVTVLVASDAVGEAQRVLAVDAGTA